VGLGSKFAWLLKRLLSFLCTKPVLCCGVGGWALPYASAWQQYHLRPRRFWFTLGHAALFGLMVAATYARQKLLWWAAVVIISLKLYRLLKYYALFNYLESSNVYHRDYTLLLYHLRDVAPWLWLPSELFFGNHALSAALLTSSRSSPSTKSPASTGLFGGLLLRLFDGGCPRNTHRYGGHLTGGRCFELEVRRAVRTQ
jgi:hypothetical protein